MKDLKRTLGTIGLVLAVMGCAPAAFAQAAPEITAQTLIDRAKIEDMLARYMTELGHSTIEAYVAFYTEDAELIMGDRTVKGRKAIFDNYTAIRAAAGTMRAQAFAFNTLLSNPLITVRGDTATVQLTFTEVITDTQNSPPRLLVQGREYDELAPLSGASGRSVCFAPRADVGIRPRSGHSNAGLRSCLAATFPRDGGGSSSAEQPELQWLNIERARQF